MTWRVAAVLIAAGLLFVAVLWRLGPFPADDGAFFLRYAQNMAAGHFWVWNVGEPPVWGASDPLWPLLIAIPIRLHVDPQIAMQVTAIGVSLVAVLVAMFALAKKFGPFAAIALLVFVGVDSGLTFFMGSGLETPLSLALISFGIYVLLFANSEVLIGISAGLLIVNKLTTIPAGILLLAAVGARDQHFPLKAFVIAMGIGCAWYAFAWIYFGTPVPNAFLTKVFNSANISNTVPRSWFSNLVLFTQPHNWFLPLAAIGLIVGLWKLSPLALFLGGTVLCDLIAFTALRPPEPYGWYAMPPIFCLMVGAAIGTALVAKAISSIFDHRRTGTIFGALFVAGYIGFVIPVSMPLAQLGTKVMVSFSDQVERDRADAGRWVAENTPASFVVLTAWGNPAFYSQRSVIDISFLNRKPEAGDLVKKYRPEVMIMEGGAPTTPQKPVFGIDTSGYELVRMFDAGYKAGSGYYYAVLARADVVGQISNVDPTAVNNFRAATATSKKLP